MQWISRYERPAQALVMPPFIAARGGRPMPFDYADWTVLGMRAARGVEPERTYASALVDSLSQGAFPFVIADFRLDYIPGAARGACVDVALCNCIAFGSKNSALVVRRHGA